MSVLSPYDARPLDFVISPTDKERVLEHLHQVCQSAEFARSSRMIDFLRLITNSAIEGKQGLLTERLIGTEVFGRPGDWDPAGDTIVRSEARRLRSKLENYYAGAGSNDSIRIGIPKGRYIPTFEITPLPAPASAISPVAEEKRRRSILLLAVLGGVVLLVLAGLLFRSRHSAHPGQSAFQIVPFSTEIGRESSPAISPDGRWIAYVWDGDRSQPDIYIKGVLASTSSRLDKRSAQRLFPAWSPDGKTLAYLEVTDDSVLLMVHSIPGNEEREITRLTKEVGHWAQDNSSLLGNPGPGWIPDGKSLIVSDRQRESATGGLYAISLDGKRRQITATRGEEHDLYPRVSGDGKEIAFVRYVRHGVADLYTVPVSGGTPTRLTQDHHTIQGITWAHDSSNLLISSNRENSFQIWSVNRRDHSLERVMTDSSSATEPDLSPDGSWLVYTEPKENWNVWRASLREGTLGTPLRLLSSSGRNYDARYSPDGNSIAFVSDRSGAMEIWVAGKEGENLRQLTHLKSPWLGGLSWSPDGRALAFDSRVQGHAAIYTVAAAGGEPRVVDSNAFEERMPAWSADGTKLYYNSVRSDGLAIWRRSLADAKSERVTAPGMFAASADEDTLWFSSRLGEMWQANPDGTNPRQLPAEIRADPVMSWAVIQGDLYFTQKDSATGKYVVRVYEHKQVRMLGSMQKNLVPNAPDIGLSPDQRWLLFAQQDDSGSDLKIRREVGTKP